MHWTAFAHCSRVRMLTDIGPVEVAWRWRVKVSGTLPARYQVRSLILMGAFEITRCGCSRSAFVWASSPRVAVRFACVLSSWSWRMRLRPVSDSFCVVSDRIDAWLLDSSRYRKPTASAEIRTVDVSAVAHQCRSRY